MEELHWNLLPTKGLSMSLQLFNAPIDNYLGVKNIQNHQALDNAEDLVPELEQVVTSVILSSQSINVEGAQKGFDCHSLRIDLVMVLFLENGFDFVNTTGHMLHRLGAESSKNDFQEDLL